MRDINVNSNIIVYCDSSAARGISNRIGLGKMRHMSVQYLWIQEKVKNGDIEVFKINTFENPADVLTKPVTEGNMLKALAVMGAYFVEGRPTAAPTLDV